MNYYQDITLISNSEINLGYIWQKVFQQVHIALAEEKNANGNSDIAVSFPEYDSKNFPLGSKLRLLAYTSEQLQQLDICKWLNRLTDYCHFTSIKEVPQAVSEFMHFKRVQFDTNLERMARRRAKRKGESLDQAMQYFKDFKDKESALPFINMISLSGNKRFRLFIAKEAANKEKTGEFNCYGLSKTATVPWFK